MSRKIVKIQEINQIEDVPCRILEYEIFGLSKREFERFVKAMIRAGFRVYIYARFWCHWDGMYYEVVVKNGKLFLNCRTEYPILFRLENMLRIVLARATILSRLDAPSALGGITAIQYQEFVNEVKRRGENYKEVIITCKNCYCKNCKFYCPDLLPRITTTGEIFQRTIDELCEIRGFKKEELDI